MARRSAKAAFACPRFSTLARLYSFDDAASASAFRLILTKISAI